MNPVEIIRKKRDSEKLTREEIEYFVNGYVHQEIPDYQASAFLMASYLNGLDEDETFTLTDVMLNSGTRIDLRELESPVVDKHSTGGVGDKISIVLAPIMAAAGVVVPMISGRALGHTGGTLDKLESIPGFRTALPLIDIRNNLWDIGVVMAGQTNEIAPADRKLYALRDVTATVESIPLIASSIMSKKLAEGLDGLVLDVKVGKGAFMKDVTSGEALAKAMIKIGKNYGVRTIALITDMNEPLGKAVGNSLEIRECINFLKGRAEPDIMELVLALGSYMLFIAEECVSIGSEKAVDLSKAPTPEKIEEKRINIEGIINSGKALEKFVELIENQGGNPEVVANPGLLPVSSKILPVLSKTDGYIREVNAGKIGLASTLIGAGRLRKEDNIDHSAGITLNRKKGDLVSAGEPLAVLHYNDESNIKEAENLVHAAYSISHERPHSQEIVLKVLHN